MIEEEKTTEEELSVGAKEKKKKKKTIADDIIGEGWEKFTLDEEYINGRAGLKFLVGEDSLQGL